MDETTIDNTADRLAGNADKGEAGKFYEEVQSLVDDVKKGNLSPAQYNQILRKAEGRQTANGYFDEITLHENGQEVKCDNGKKVKLDGAGLHFVYTGSAHNAFDRQGNR